MFCRTLTLPTLPCFTGWVQILQWHFSNCRSLQCIFLELLKILLLHLITMFSGTEYHLSLGIHQVLRTGGEGSFSPFYRQGNQGIEFGSDSPKACCRARDQEKDQHLFSSHFVLQHLVLLFFPLILPPATVCPPSSTAQNGHSRASTFVITNSDTAANNENNFPNFGMILCHVWCLVTFISSLMISGSDAKNMICCYPN